MSNGIEAYRHYHGAHGHYGLGGFVGLIVVVAIVAIALFIGRRLARNRINRTTAPRQVGGYGQPPAGGYPQPPAAQPTQEDYDRLRTNPYAGSAPAAPSASGPARQGTTPSVPGSGIWTNPHANTNRSGAPAAQPTTPPPSGPLPPGWGASRDT